jgi:hypothetical protein
VVLLGVNKAINGEMIMIKKFVAGLATGVLLLGLIGQTVYSQNAPQSNDPSREKVMASLGNQQIDILETYLKAEKNLSIIDTATFTKPITYIPTKDELKNALASSKLMKEADNLALSDKYDEAIETRLWPFSWKPRALS